jgi:hypothetical protein
MPMNCNFCNKPIEKDESNKWVTVETQKAHYWECDSPNAPRLKGKKTFQKKEYSPKQATVDATPQVIDILSAFGKQLTRLEEKIDGVIASTAFKKANDDPLDPNATLRNPEDVGK